MVLGPDRKRLSKRHGATSVEELRDAGYLPEAVVNVLALVGWSLDYSHELFSRAELVGLFSLERVNPAPARVRPPEARAPERPAHPGAVGGRAGPADPGLPRGARLGARLAARPWCVEVDPAGAGEDQDAGRVRAALRVPVRHVEFDQAAWERVAGDERAADILDAVQAALGACDVDGRGDRGGAARRLRAARAQAPRRLRPGPGGA